MPPLFARFRGLVGHDAGLIYFMIQYNAGSYPEVTSSILVGSILFLSFYFLLALLAGL